MKKHILEKNALKLKTIFGKKYFWREKGFEKKIFGKKHLKKILKKIKKKNFGEKHIRKAKIQKYCQT